MRRISLNIKGFTLNDMIIVLCIIVILVIAMLPFLPSVFEKSKVSATLSDFEKISDSAHAFYADNAVWPANNCSDAFLNNTDCSGGNYMAWKGPYIERWPPNARWGGSYEYYNNASLAWDVGSPVGSRYVQIGSVPDFSAQQLDQKLDNEINNSIGIVRYTPEAAPGRNTLRILISKEEN